MEAFFLIVIQNYYFFRQCDSVDFVLLVSMNIISINTFSHTGGASIAAVRIMDALSSIGEDASMLTYYKDGEHSDIEAYTDSYIGTKLRWWKFVYERLRFLPYEANKEIRFHFSLANAGVDLASHPMVKNADAIHLHWFNKSYLSLKGLGKLLEMGKPIIWTLHDMWAFTGGCHYNYNDCISYQSKCRACPMIKNSRKDDLSTKIWLEKKDIYAKAKGNLHFVTCSDWLGDEVRNSALLSNYPVTTIPNPIDSTFFKPLEKSVARDRLEIKSRKRLILFVAMNTTDERKGFRFLAEALKKVNNEDAELLVIGKAKKETLEALPLEVNYLGFIKSKEKMHAVYNAADVYVSPTLQDNLPNTVMESLSCGTPVVAFNTGGVPEMVEDGKEGRIVPQRDVPGLAKAIDWVLEDETRYRKLSENARQKVLDKFSYSKVANQYLRLFESMNHSLS